MRKHLLILSAVLLTAFSGYAQVAISNPATAPDASAMLDVKSANRGFLMPRVALRTDVASPATGLLVYETTSNGVWMYNGSVWVQLGSGSGAGQWITNGTNIYNSNTGNVGIGLSTNINKKLTVLGNALFVNPAEDNNVVLSLMGVNGNGGGRINFIKPDSSIVGSIYSNALFNRMFLQQGTNNDQLVLHANGNVGINVSLPTARLDVVGNIRSRDTITADNDLVAVQDIRAGDDITAGDRIDAGGVIEGHGLSSIGSLYVNGTSLMNGALTNTSTAAITGNITSSTGVTINNATGILAFRTGSDDKGFVQLSGDNLRLGTYATNTTGKFVVRTGGADQLFIDETGNMGFGTSAPLSKIQIPTGNDASLSSNGYLMLGAVNGSNIVMDNNEIVARSNGAVGNLVLQNDGGTVRIGSVGVPTGYKFAINGKMICEEVRVKLAANWPDYVFKNDYKLLPLPELKKYIEENNHLPNIPKAIVVEKEGLEMGDMQKKLMEKVEEMTLYILDLQKQVDELKAKVNTTKSN